MKILYAIQGTGNGHISRAKDIVPILKRFGELDLLISGTESEVSLSYPIKYRFHGLGFVFGKNGGIDYLETFRKNNIKRLYREIMSLDVESYDIVISDFEPVSSWACYLRNKPCIGLSHQIAVISNYAPQPLKTDIVGQAFLKYYAPASHQFGFHFKPYASNIFTPVIRKEVRELEPGNDGHYTVYLPAFSDKRIKSFLEYFPDIRWEVFSKRAKKPYAVGDNVHFFPVNNDRFLKSMQNATGVLCGAGFETPAEAIYLGKTLMVVPMKGQFEQHCNAAALYNLGVPVIKNLKRKHIPLVNIWLNSGRPVSLQFPEETEFVIQSVIDQFLYVASKKKLDRKSAGSVSRFRELLLKKIFYHQKNVVV